MFLPRSPRSPRSPRLLRFAGTRSPRRNRVASPSQCCLAESMLPRRVMVAPPSQCCCLAESWSPRRVSATTAAVSSCQWRSAADSLLARPDLWRSDPLPRAAPEAADPWAAMRRASPKRKPLARVSREEAAGRHRTAAIEVPNAPRRRGENRAASTMNRAPGWRSAMIVPMGAPVIDLT